MPANPDQVVTSVATRLMQDTAGTADKMSERVLAQPLEQFDVDAGFLRHHDDSIWASKLVAEWPPRYERPGFDPLEIVYFADADPLFASSEHAKQPAVVQVDPTNYGYPSHVGANGRVVLPSVAVAPLVRGGTVTTGVLGFAKFGDRAWAPEEINALEAIAALFAQPQDRNVAEDKLRCLAEHDHLTDLFNRRALIAHPHDRLAARQPGPVAVLYIDVDILKSVDDDLSHSGGDRFISVLAQRLQLKVKCLGMIVRVGGDQVVIISNQPTPAGDAETLWIDWMRP